MSKQGKTALKWIIIGLLVCGGLGYYFYARSQDRSPILWQTVKVSRGSVEQVVTATGQLSAVVTVQVGSQVSGTIASLGADFNSKVEKGQIIAQIDPTRFKANLAQAKASLQSAFAAVERSKVASEQAKRDYERGQALFSKHVIGEAELEALKTKRDSARVELISSQAQVAQAQAVVGMAKVDLERTTIRAPISGTVLNRAVDVGQTVAASLQAPILFAIAQDLTHMEVRAAIDESDVGKLRAGLEARFRVDAYPGEEFIAKIFMVRSQPTVQQNVVSYDAVLRVDNPDQKLKPGMTASVRIVCERRDGVLRIPNAALRFRPPAEVILQKPEEAGEGRRPRDAGAPTRRGEGGRGQGGVRVYKPEGNKVVPLRLRPGLSDDEFTEVLRGNLQEGDEIVVDMVGGMPGSQESSPASKRGQGPGARSRGPRFF